MMVQICCSNTSLVVQEKQRKSKFVEMLEQIFAFYKKKHLTKDTNISDAWLQ